MFPCMAMDSSIPDSSSWATCLSLSPMVHRSKFMLSLFSLGIRFLVFSSPMVVHLLLLRAQLQLPSPSQVLLGVDST